MELPALCTRLLMLVSVLPVTKVHLKHAQDSGSPLIVPSSLQLFEYKNGSFKCEGFRVQTGLTVMRRIKGNISECVNNRESATLSTCTIEPAYTADSGEYWCENRAGERSNSVTVNITAGAVILDSPVSPVKEGEDVTLRCKTSFTHTANFYKDGLLMGSGSAGEISIQSVSKAHEGFYTCSISDLGDSPQSWMAVRAGPRETRPSSGPSSGPSCHPYLVLRTVLTAVMVALLVLLLGLIHFGKLRVTQKYVCICEVCKGSCQRGRQRGDNDKEQ